VNVTNAIPIRGINARCASTRIKHTTKRYLRSEIPSGVSYAADDEHAPRRAEATLQPQNCDTIDGTLCFETTPSKILFCRQRGTAKAFIQRTHNYPKNGPVEPRCVFE
jgi:hypothetical protein